jgi:thiamine kinase-like enzyme
MALQTPKPYSWMDEKFFETVIRDYQKDPNAKLNSFEVNAGVKPGDNAGSLFFKAKLNYSSKFEKEKDLAVVIKAVPETDNVENPLYIPVFLTEMKIYSEILPQFAEIWKNANDYSMVVPKLIYQSTSPHTVIVLEDLSVKGFKMTITPPENFEDSKMIVQRLAKFHASSFFFLNEKNVDYSGFSNCLFKYMPFGDNIKVLADEVETWEGFEKFAPALRELAENYQQRVLKVYEPNPSGQGYNVLCHGDFHMKNIMLNRDGDTLKDVCMLDYQMVNYSSPVVDLIYSLYFDLSAENRKQYRDEYIMYYYTEFVKALKSFGFLRKPPTLLDLQIELLKNGVLESVLCLAFYAFMWIDFSAMEDPMALLIPENLKKFQQERYRDPEIQETIKRELPRLIYNGLI